MMKRKSSWELFRWLEREMEEAENLFRRIKETERRTGCITPLYNVVEADNEFIVSVDMPGVEKSEITLDLRGEHLVLEAPCKQQLPSSRYGDRFRLVLRLPEEVESTGKARYVNGVLEIRIPRKGRGGTRIPVE